MRGERVSTVQMIKDAGFNLLDRLPALPFFLLKRRSISIGDALAVYRQVMANMNSVTIKKKTDTLAVMGSGPSINELTSRDMDFLQAVDGFALNRWAYHELVPDFYMLEGASSDTTQKELLRLLRRREQEYRDVVFLAKYVPWFLRRGSLAEEFAQLPKGLVARLRLLSIRRVRYGSLEEFDETPYQFLDPTGPLPQARGSVYVILSWAFSMGYEVVILYGVDLSSDGYFWEGRSDSSAGLHATAQARKDELSMLDLIPLMRQHLYVPNGRELFIASKTSELFPQVPLWQYQVEPRSAPAEFN